MATAVGEAKGVIVVFLQDLIRRRITRHLHDPVAVFVRK